MNDVVIGQKPQLSIVVPIYNVEDYLHECLESIASQEIEDFEAILVNDGSTDESINIARFWCERDDRFRLIEQENAGLGAARNTGASDITGKYLTFLDSDDIAIKDAWSRMIATLETSGSDFATGNVERFDSVRTWQAPMYKGLLKESKLSTHVTKDFSLIEDHLTPNKVWRSSFWISQDIKFPEGVLYEDVPTIVPAHVKAETVDIVSFTTALWRVREHGDKSITQARAEDPKHVKDRVQALLSNSQYLSDRGLTDLKVYYDTIALKRDLWLFMSVYLDVDDTYRYELIDAVSRFILQTVPDALKNIPAERRIAYELLTIGANRELADVLRQIRNGTMKLTPLTVENNRVLLDLGFRETEPRALPETAFDVTSELELKTRVTDIRLSSKGLEIDGWAYIDRLHGTDGLNSATRVWLEDDDNWIEAKVEPRRDERAGAFSTPPVIGADDTAFTARIPISKLRRGWRYSSRNWKVMVSVTSGPIEKSQPLAPALPKSAKRHMLHELKKGWWLRSWWERDALHVSASLEKAFVTGATKNGDGLDITITSNQVLPPDTEIRFKKAGQKKWATGCHVVVEDEQAKVGKCHFDLQQLYDGEDVPEYGGDDIAVSWDLSLRVGPEDHWQRLLTAPTLTSQACILGDRELRLWPTKTGTSRITWGPIHAELESVEWGDDATVDVVVRHHQPHEVTALVLAARKHTEQHIFDTTVQDGAVQAKLDLHALTSFGDVLPIRAGTWSWSLRERNGDVPIIVLDPVEHGLPQTTRYRDRDYTITDLKRSELNLEVSNDLEVNERGRSNQHQLQHAYYPSLLGETAIKPVVFYESYFGKQFSDSPADIFEYLSTRRDDLEHVVSVRDQQVALPAGARPVAYRSREYFEALASSQYVISNSHLPAGFTRTPGQTVVQTWHGVGTKRIGLDIAHVGFANPTYKESIVSESANWDYLISPNSSGSEILSRAFSYNGKLLETGMPRNDIFYRNDRGDIAQRVKARLGIHPAQKMVLYAPTWRDNVRSGGRYLLDLKLDVANIAAQLGNEYAVVFRRHANVVDTLGSNGSGVIDASHYPDAQQLLIACDILISDYSTMMCDFANTSRPILCYTYDLEFYRDVLRDFYFDFENCAPGPLIDNELDLLQAIKDADTIRSRYDDRYSNFANRFCEWDDGNATQRVANAIFGT